jgi:hypothetical protein
VTQFRAEDGAERLHAADPAHVSTGLSPKGTEGSSDRDLREQLAQLKADNEHLKLQH